MTIFYALLPHPSDPRLLILTEKEGCSLPSSALPRDEFEPEAFNRAIGGRTGLRVTTLRPAGPCGAAETEDPPFFVWTENHSPDGVPPPGGLWADRETIRRRPDLPEAQRAAAEAWFEDQASGPPPERSPWAIPGWRDAAREWIAGELKRVGLPQPDAIEQRRTCGISCVLKAATEDGDVYFKASHPLFGHEARLTEALAHRYPPQLPKLIGADGERNWLLMRDFGGKALGGIDDRAIREDAMRRFARMQIDSLGYLEELKALGCYSRPTERLWGDFEATLQDSDSLGTERNDSLTEEERSRIETRRPALRAAWERLARLEIPDALLHGDLHANNIAVTDHGPVFYDWSDGAVGNPFFDLPLIVGFPDDLASDPIVKEGPLAAYLEEWAEVLPPETLAEAVDLSFRMAPLYHAQSYRWICRNLEPKARDEMRGGISYFLRTLLPKPQEEAAAT